ncbi:MAG: hypothetical protein K6G89_02725 [Clostridia bacterium]|nr:hypothetical protein [Clostridia bacterium]
MKKIGLLLVLALTLLLFSTGVVYSKNNESSVVNLSDADSLLGDVDEDGELTDWDEILFQRHLAGWKNISVNEAVLDIDGDGEASDWDAILLGRFLAGWEVNELNNSANERTAPAGPIHFAYTEKHVSPGEIIVPEVFDANGDAVTEGVSFRIEVNDPIEDNGIAEIINGNVVAEHPGICTVKAQTAEGQSASFVLYVKGLKTFRKSCPNEIELKVGETLDVEIEIEAIDVESCSVTYEVTGGVRFDGKTITADSIGVAKITFTVSDGTISRSDICVVTVFDNYDFGNYISPEERTAEDIEKRTPSKKAKYVGTSPYTSGRWEGMDVIINDTDRVVVYAAVRDVAKDNLGQDYQGIPAGLSFAAITEKGEKVDFSYTNENGVLMFVLKPGKYYIDIEGDPQGYLPYTHKDVFAVSNMDGVRINNTLVHLLPEDSFPETCTFIVRDESGNPIKGAKITVSNYDIFRTDEQGRADLKCLAHYRTTSTYFKTINFRIEADGYLPLYAQNVQTDISGYTATMITVDTVIRLASELYDMKHAMLNEFAWFKEDGAIITAEGLPRGNTYREVKEGFDPNGVVDYYRQILTEEYLEYTTESKLFEYFLSGYYFDGEKYYYTTQAPAFKYYSNAPVAREPLCVDEDMMRNGGNGYSGVEEEVAVLGEGKLHIWIRTKLRPDAEPTSQGLPVDLHRFVFENGSWHIS